VAAAQTADVLEEDQILAVIAVEDSHPSWSRVMVVSEREIGG
jgi:hypothetical protein